MTTERMTDERLAELEQASEGCYFGASLMAELFAELHRARAAEPVDPPASAGPVEDERRLLGVHGV